MTGKRVLVVDDEHAVRELTSAILHKIRHRAETAASGAEALRMIDSTEFDLIITDLYMPEMNGDELARKIKTRRPCLPIILITGAGLEHRPDGFVEMLRKPFTLIDLEQVVEKVLSTGG